MARYDEDRYCKSHLLTVPAILFRLLEITIELGTETAFGNLAAHLKGSKARIEILNEMYFDLYDDGIHEILARLDTFKMLPVQDAIEQLVGFINDDAAAHAIYAMRVRVSAIRLQSRLTDVAPRQCRDSVPS